MEFGACSGGKWKCSGLQPESESAPPSVVSDELRAHGLSPARLLCLWNSPGKNTRVGCHFLLLGIFPTLGPNPGLLHCRWILYCLSHQGSPSPAWELRGPCPFGVLWELYYIGIVNQIIGIDSASSPSPSWEIRGWD